MSGNKGSIAPVCFAAFTANGSMRPIGGNRNIMSYKLSPRHCLSLAAVAIAASFSLQPANSQATISTTEIIACGHLFNIDANADHKTAAERAALVQRNLDNALVTARDRSPGAVQVDFQNHNPIVTLDHQYIVTADNNSAVRAGITQGQLAERWANSLRSCLADRTMLSTYISSLTGRFPVQKRSTRLLNRTDVGVLPWGTNLPVAVDQDLDVTDAGLGTPITLKLITDVPLGPGFSTYLPTGTLALGELVDAEPNNPNRFGGRGALMAHFYALQTPDGAQIPISGHIMGGLNSWRAASILPMAPAYDKRVQARLYTDINEGVSMNGTGGSKMFTASTSPDLKLPAAFPGVIAGGWRGLEEDTVCQEGFPKLTLSRHSGLFLPAGERMTLQLSATTAVSVISPDPSESAIAAVNAVGL